MPLFQSHRIIYEASLLIFDLGLYIKHSHISSNHISSNANYFPALSGSKVFNSLPFVVSERCAINCLAHIQLQIGSNIKWRLHSLVKRSRANGSALRFCLHFVFVFKSSGRKTLISVKCLGTPPAPHTLSCGLAQYPICDMKWTEGGCRLPYLYRDLTFRDTQLSTLTFNNLSWHLHFLAAMCSFDSS